MQAVTKLQKEHCDCEQIAICGIERGIILKKLFNCFLGLIVLLIFCLNIAKAQNKEKPLAGGDLSLYSKYVWRGLVFDEDPVLQPDFWMQAYGITMIFWGNMDLTDQDGEYLGQFNEWDTFIDFSLGSYGAMIFGGGLYYLNFPSSSGEEGPSTAEVSAWISGDITGSPALTIYWDIWQYHGIYANLNLSHGINFGPGNLSVSSSLGWGDAKHNLQSGVADAGGWLDFQVDASYSFMIHRMVTLIPAMHYSTILQDDIRDEYSKAGVNADGFFFSVSASFEI